MGYHQTEDFSEVDAVLSVRHHGYIQSLCGRMDGGLIEETCLKQRIEKGQLTIHADRGSGMRSKTVTADLGVLKTHSRPCVSNDNPFSEARFKTLKYAPVFPGRFRVIEDAGVFGRCVFSI